MSRASSYQEAAVSMADHGMTLKAMQHLMNILRRQRSHGLSTSGMLQRLLRAGVLQPKNMVAAGYLERAVLHEGPEFDPVKRERWQDARRARHEERNKRRLERGSALARPEHVYVGSDRRQVAR